MANINKISSFKSFSEVKSQESTVKLREANNTKRQETVNKLASILDEMGLTSLEGLEEVQRNGIIDKMFASGSLEKVDPPTPPGKKLKEGNAFGDAVRKAKEAGDDEFDFEGKTFKVEESIKESFYRLPKKVISNDMYVIDNRMQQLTSVVSNGSDLDIKALDNIISMLQDVRKSAKKFDKKEDLLGTVYESLVNEAKGFKNTKDFEDFLEEIDAMREYDIKKFMGNNYIDTPGGYRDEADDYYNDITKYMISNMGLTEFNKLKTYWENNVRESLVNEADIKSDDEFKDYAVNLLKQAFGDEFDEDKSQEVIDGILQKSDGDYGAAVGMLTSSLG
jgi:hypothetical protein